MARIAGVDLPNEKRVEIGLTYIFGIGLTTSKKILADTGIDPDVRVKDLTEDDISKLREYIDHNLQVEGDRRRTIYKQHIFIFKINKVSYKAALYITNVNNSYFFVALSQKRC